MGVGRKHSSTDNTEAQGEGLRLQPVKNCPLWSPVGHISFVVEKEKIVEHEREIACTDQLVNEK